MFTIVTVSYTIPTMIVLGIETSCDETSTAIYDSEKGLLAHQIYSQIKIHAPYGGVVPELASRDHIKKTLPLIKQVLTEAKLQKNDLSAIAYTKGPGLIGALMVGACIGRSLGFALNIPTIGVHHLEAHLMAVMLEKEKPEFPFVALLVSGGHTMLIEVQRPHEYRLLGESLDDAVGEAFDKTAKLLGLSYPGGPALAALAEQGNPNQFQFPRPMVSHPGLDFSFSGIKTFAMNCYRSQNNNNENLKADIASSFQEAVVDALIIKCKRALDQTKLKRLVVVGGVGANKKLREKLQKEIQKRKGTVYFPRSEFCTDNAAMVAYTGYLHLFRNEKDTLAIDAKARWLLFK